ncbi:hypothetical protein [Bosea sp. (in: a-proteobacteria)]|uniref:hypothetical protein n=1 Tax=Bosea sp. (in: a-proteobacteria) TaxID=1871050 RepID=UPI003B3A2F8E
MAKRERRGGRQAVENWHQRALELDLLLKDVRRGKRDQVYRSYAERLGVSVAVPRRMIQALRFVDYVRDRVGFGVLAEQIAQQPLMSLVVLDSWSQYAPDHALSAARRLVAGEINLPMLKALERADRATGETVLAATDGTWQSLAANRAIAQVQALHKGAHCIWAARGWRPDGIQFTTLTLPNLLGTLPALPGVQLAFDVGTVGPLLVAILTDRVTRPRSPAALLQPLLTLLGYTRLGCSALLLLREPDDATTVEDLLSALGHPDGLVARRFAFD